MSEPTPAATSKSLHESLVDLFKALLWPMTALILLTCNNSPVQRIADGIAIRAKDTSKKFSMELGASSVKVSSEEYAAARELGKKDTASQAPVPKTDLTAVSKAAPPPALVNDASILNERLRAEAIKTWVYIGQMVDGKLTNCHFILNDLPIAGQRIVARDAVYRRETFPARLPDNTYQLGKSVGVVAGGESATVIELRPIPNDNNYWALVQ